MLYSEVNLIYNFINYKLFIFIYTYTEKNWILFDVPLTFFFTIYFIICLKQIIILNILSFLTI